jgi:hypothetical protein
MSLQFEMPPLDNSPSTMGPTDEGSALRRVRTNEEYKSVTAAVAAYVPPRSDHSFWRALETFDPETQYDGFDVVPEGIYLRDDKDGNPVRFEASGTIYLAFKGSGNPADTVAAEIKGRLGRDGDGKLMAQVTDLIPLMPA